MIEQNAWSFIMWKGGVLLGIGGANGDQFIICGGFIISLIAICTLNKLGGEL